MLLAAAAAAAAAESKLVEVASHVILSTDGDYDVDDYDAIVRWRLHK